MSQARYSKDHEYVVVEGDIGTVGISEHAQGQLGDVVFVELPAIGDKLTAGAQAAVVESVKAASEVFSPVSGDVVANNTALESEPSLINEDAMGKGWIFKVKLSNPAEADALMDEAGYQDFLKSIA
jgi:glycine cleavage system H protein